MAAASASDPKATAELVRKADLRTSARLMRDLDDLRPGAVEVMKHLYPHTGRAFMLGITGNPGAGKSTVVDALIHHYRQLGKRVGVVAVDPTSPFSGGAILGDRIRMQRHATDEGVFIRSLATRGHLGGLSRSTGEVAAVLDAMGYDLVIIETVGVGQDEIDVVSQCECAVVVTVPGMGDEIQAIKAGILEIADVFVVNKADLEGHVRVVAELRSMLSLAPKGQWKPPILATIAAKQEGIEELWAAVLSHRQHLESSGRARELAAQRLKDETAEAAAEIARDRVRRSLSEDPALAERLLAEGTPYQTAEEILDRGR